MTAVRAVAVVVMLGMSAIAAAQPPPPPPPHRHAPPSPPPDEPAGHVQAEPLPPFIPPPTEADRAAAFPEVEGHRIHDDATNFLVLFDQFEGQTGHGASGFSWDTKGWVGGDRTRLWYRTEGDRIGGRLEQAHGHVLLGRSIARWWDVTAGLRQDSAPGLHRTALAFGVQGLAPYWFEVEASAYVEFSGRTHLRLETEYDLLITNRLILQPLAEIEIYGRADPERRLDVGPTIGELGFRLRYELRRELAPYIGVVWTRKFFGTADAARAAGERTAAARLAVGLRFWM